jgi:hypothetical protein
MMRIWTSKVSALAMLLAIAGCSGISVSTDYDTTKDFSTYQTFSWMEVPSSKQAQGYDTSGLMDARVKEAVDKQLESKGLAEVSDNADLLLAYHYGTEEQLQIDDYGYGYGPWCGGSGIDVYKYKEGTLIVDIVDAATKKLVWRGAAEGALSENPSGPELNYVIDSAVAKMFKSFPPSK